MIRALTLALLFMLAATAKAGSLDPALKLLLSSSFDDKSRAIALLGEDGGEIAEALLSAIVDSRLYYVKKDRRIVVVDKSEAKYRLTDPLSGEDLGSVSKRKVKKISINNRLRGEIRSAISRIKLTHEQASVRLTAVETLMGEADDEDLLQLRSMRESETSAQVIGAIDVTAQRDAECAQVGNRFNQTRLKFCRRDLHAFTPVPASGLSWIGNGRVRRVAS